MTREKRIERREFLKRSSVGAAALAAPAIIPSRALGRDGATAPSERVRVGHIGVGGQGGGLLSHFLGVEDSESVAVCDPFGSRRDARKQQVEQYYADQASRGSFKGCTAYRDFRDLLERDDIDAVVIATPDHWHVPIGIAAARAGKDMYIEKPLGLSMEQNKAMRAAVRRYGRVFQYGTQQRGQHHIRVGCELVRSGYVGEIRELRVDAPGGSVGGSTKVEPVPEDLDYDLWLGPAPVAPYTHDRCVGTGRWFCYDYAIGFLGGWGAHPLDVLHWGYPDSIPVEYVGTGVIPTEGLFDTIAKWDVQGVYANGVPFTFRDGGDRTTFVGDEGWIALSRGGWDAEPKSLLREVARPGEVHLHESNDHKRDFIRCVKSREDPASPIESAVQSDFISHLSDIAIRTGRRIVWDPEKETIIGDCAAERMMVRPMRSPWRL